MTNVKHPPIKKLTMPIAWFVRMESFSGIFLLVCTVAALVLANSPLSGFYSSLWDTRLSVGIGSLSFSKDLHFWINDGLMAIFFFVVGLEIKREALVGELSSLKKAAFPAFAALGGMLAPALIFVAFNLGGSGIRGWGIPTATDIAFAIGILSLLGKRVPFTLKIFLTALAIVDDLGAVMVIAIFYSADISLVSLGISLLFLIGLVLANRLGIRHPFIYVTLGIGLWIMFYETGIHPTIAGVVAAMTIPARTRINTREFIDSGRRHIDMIDKSGGGRDGSVLTNSRQHAALVALEDACEQAEPPMLRLEHGLNPWVTYLIMPLFAFANAGVGLAGNLAGAITSPLALGIALGLIIGKPLGIFSITRLAVFLKLASKPAGVSWSKTFGVSIFGGIGFTMSLFIASLAFDGTELLPSAKIGILAGSFIAAVLGYAVMLMLTPKKPKSGKKAA